MPYKNIEEKRKAGQRYYWKHRNVIMKKNREHRLSHLEEEKIRGKLYREAHKEQIKQVHHDYAQRDYVKAIVAKSTRKWRKKNPEKGLAYYRQHYEKIASLMSLSMKEYRLALYYWSKTIGKMYNNVCQICGINKRLHTHHIFSKSEFPELSLNVNNGILLCKKHHLEVHGSRQRIQST